MSHSSPESATWQPGEVFTPTSSYTGSQSDDNLPLDGQPAPYGSLNSIASSSPDTMASGFSENSGVRDTSPTWGSPLSNERLLADLSMPSMFITSFIARSFEKSHLWKLRTKPHCATPGSSSWQH